MPRRAYVYGMLLLLLCLMQVPYVVAQGYGDWSLFWSAGATVGSRALLDPHLHAQWQRAHHVYTGIFPYLPGAAWLLAPVLRIPLGVGYAVNFTVMAVLAVFAALAGARVYGLARSTAVLLTFAWAPLIAGPATGQNAPASVLLAIAAAGSIAAESWLGAGLATGLMLYKPLYAVPFVLYLVVTRRWRALAVVAGCAALWYAASAAAAAGDWQWPIAYADAIRSYALQDAHLNAVKAISVTQLLLRVTTNPPAAYAAGAALFFAALPALARMERLAAASLLPLIALITGPHTLPYDVALALPAIFYFTSHAQEPFRTRVLAWMYLLAPLWLLSDVFKWDVLAPICYGLIAAVLGCLLFQREAVANQNVEVIKGARA